MIATRHWPLFMSVFGAYTAHLFRRRFHAMWVRGNLPDDDAPRMAVVQHVAWWDPLVIYHLSRAHLAPGRHFVMMDEANLRRMKFFRWIGAFGVDRASRAGAVAGMRYALARLAEPRARVWLFPQGHLRPTDARPLGCEAGAAWLAARAGVPVVPVALRYEFGESEHPEVFVSIGAARTLDAARARPRDHGGVDPVEALLTAEADRLRDDLYAGRLEGFVRVVRGRGKDVPRVAAFGHTAEHEPPAATTPRPAPLRRE